MVMLLESLVLRTKGSYFFAWINVILLTLPISLNFELRIQTLPEFVSGDPPPLPLYRRGGRGTFAMRQKYPKTHSRAGALPLP